MDSQRRAHSTGDTNIAAAALRRKAVAMVLLAAMLATAGCRSSRQAANAPAGADSTAPGQTAAPAAEAAPAAKERTVTNFDATFEGIGMNGQLRIVQDSALWVSVTKIIEVGRGLATRDSVWISAPILDVRFAGTYADLSRKAGRKLTFDKLQQMALADNAEQELQRLAAELGFNAKVHITSRRKVDRLGVPFRK